jgi:hypothetical protein
MRELYLGDEAIIDTATFSLTGRHMRPVRQATNRTINHGITCEVYREGALDPTLRRALIGIADRHRGEQAERGFSMALDGLLEGRHPDALVTIARDPTGAPFAFQRYIPCKAGHALSLDAMRRDNVGVNGVNERMIVETITWARANGIDEVSLNFAVAREILCEDAKLSVAEAAEAWALRRLSPYFQIESLLSFNAKFHPRWVPRIPAFRLTHEIVPVAIAAFSAEAFLPLDKNRDGSRRLRRRVEATAGADLKSPDRRCADARRADGGADPASGYEGWRWRSRCTSPSAVVRRCRSTPTDTSSNRRTLWETYLEPSTGIGPCASCVRRRWARALEIGGQPSIMSPRVPVDPRRWGPRSARHATRSLSARTCARLREHGSGGRLEVLDAEGITRWCCTRPSAAGKPSSTTPSFAQAYTRHNRWICEFCAGVVSGPDRAPLARGPVARANWNAQSRQARAARMSRRSPTMVAHSGIPTTTLCSPPRRISTCRSRSIPRSSRSGRRARGWARGRTSGSCACSRR